MIIEPLLKKCDELLYEIKHNNATTLEYLEALKMICDTIQIVVYYQSFKNGGKVEIKDDNS